jgi:hypothetical protein
MRKVPKDEMLLAKMIAEAKGRGLGHCVGFDFSIRGYPCKEDEADTCCARGAMVLTGVAHTDVPWIVTDGNDYFRADRTVDFYRSGSNYTLGYAFALAMNEDA